MQQNKQDADVEKSEDTDEDTNDMKKTYVFKEHTKELFEHDASW